MLYSLVVFFLSPLIVFDFYVGTKPTKYDFKRLFTISEYYDRDCARFYRAIQSARDKGMDMTGWLEYFIKELSAQHKLKGFKPGCHADR